MTNGTKAGAFARVAAAVGEARLHATAAAKNTGGTFAYGLQLNDVTGELEAGHIPATWADRPGMLYEVYGTIDAQGNDVPRADTTPAWRRK